MSEGRTRPKPFLVFSRTYRDSLLALFTLRPIVVAGVILVTGWGSLLLIAWGTDSITEVFLKNPGFMIGDFLLLPFAGFLIARFYRQSAKFRIPLISKRWTYVAVLLATFVTIIGTLYSTLISGSYHGLWSVPHTLFIWVMTYMVASFLLNGFASLRSRSKPSLWISYLGVLGAIAAHVTIKLSVGGASFPK